MQKHSDIFVSAVLVMDSETNEVAIRVQSAAKTLRIKYSNYEVLIIDNGLSDYQLNALRKLLPSVPCIRIIRLSKVYTTDTAIFAGIEASIGDYVVTLYNSDPVELIPDFVRLAQKHDIVQGVAINLRRKNIFESTGAKIFYWYSKKYLRIDVPNGSTLYLSMNRTAANALTRSGRAVRHVRHMAQRVGFNTTTYEYSLPEDQRLYSRANTASLTFQAIDLISNYSNHPLRVLSYFGFFAGLVNVAYAAYVLIVNISDDNVAKGWTTLSLQSAFMFFILFMILAVLAEYIGKILSETQKEPDYHLLQELVSTTSVADQNRLNVTK